ncbi:unnamed protein product, partial [Tilletia controversa]
PGWLRFVPANAHPAYARTHPLHHSASSLAVSCRRLLHTSPAFRQQPIGIDSTGVPPPRTTPETSANGASRPTPTPAPGPAKPSGSSSSSSSGRSDKPPRGFAFLRRHPILAGTSFLITHLGIAWILLPPTYFFLHNLAPGGSTAMLAGPQTAWALNRSVPDSIAAAVPGFKNWAEQHVQDDGATFEDVIEYMARNASIMAWRGARSTINLFQRGRGDASADSVKKERRQEEEIADEAIRSLKGQDDGGSNKVTQNALDKFGFSKRAQDAASEIRFAQIRDAISAYIFVKTIFPLRLPLSLWLAPKLGRVFLAGMNKRRVVP